MENQNNTDNNLKCDNMWKDYSKIEYAWKIYSNTQEMIKLADQKVYVSATVSLLIVTAFFASDIGKTAITLCIGRILALSFLVSTAYFIYYALEALIPKPKSSHTKDNASKLIFFAHVIEKKEISDYVRSYSEVTSEEALKDLLCQIYEISFIAMEKHKNYGLSAKGLKYQLIFFMMTSIIHVLKDLFIQIIKFCCN